jgi:hypothetical protein
MANTGCKGINSRQTGTALLFWSDLFDSTGAFVTTGTTSLYIQELQSDGSIKTYDFNNNTFSSAAVTTETQSMTYRKSNNATTDLGLWTFALSTLTGFTIGAVYRFMVNNSNAYPANTKGVYFVYGSAEGDLITLAGSTGQAYLETDVEKWLTGTIPAVNVTGVPKVDLVDVQGISASAATQVDANVVQALGNAVTTATANGVLDVALTSKGVDNITAETGLNLRQAIAVIAASCCGTLSGNNTTTVTIDAANNAGTHRLVATIDTNDNRTAITLTPPT